MFDDTLISIHAPTRGATEQRRKLKSWFEFQSTLPREERRLSASVLSSSLIFQSTLPREERQSQVFCCFLDNYFNPRSHERSDLSSCIKYVKPVISIHAPTRGATYSSHSFCFEHLISIHAPTRGATAILHKKFVYFYTIPTINI